VSSIRKRNQSISTLASIVPNLVKPTQSSGIILSQMHLVHVTIGNVHILYRKKWEKIKFLIVKHGQPASKTIISSTVLIG